MKTLILWLSLLSLYAYAMFHGIVAYNLAGLEGTVFAFVVVVLTSGIIIIILEKTNHWGKHKCS